MQLEAALPTLVELTRGGIVETRHRGAIAVARADGTLVAWFGDPEFLTLPRSALKPFQALPVVESGAAARFDFNDTELAICCGSHSGELRHREVVASMLARAGVPLDALRNGIAPPINEHEYSRYDLGLVTPDPLFQNCSGKHAGILAACRTRGYSLVDYDRIDHPIQQEIRTSMGDCFRLPGSELVVGIDGCTLPTFGAPLRNVAAGWAAVADPDNAPRAHRVALARLVAAMAAEPWMVAGTGRLNTTLSEATGGRIVSKDGAEGVLCIAVRDRGLGMAFKLEDGTNRSHRVIAHELLRQLDALTSDEDQRLSQLYPRSLFSNRDQEVGQMQPVFTVEFAR